MARSFFLLAIAAAMPAVAGCNSLRFNYDEPPTVAALDRTIPATDTIRGAVVIQPFRNPPKARPTWSDIGPGMSEALGRTLVNEGRLDVRVRGDLGQRVETILRESPRRQREAFIQLGREHGDVNYVVTGRVTDFHHTRDDAGGPSRRTWYLKRRDEAVVAIELQVVNMRSGLVEVADHVLASADAANEPSDEVYRNMAFGTYLFWSTPLGRASRKAIEKSARRLYDIVPSRVVESRVVRISSTREIVVSGGEMARMSPGQRYYVCRKQDRDAVLRPVRDPVIGRPVMVQIINVERTTATAWLVGRLPEDLPVTELVIRRELPEPPPLATAGVSATSPPGAN